MALSGGEPCICGGGVEGARDMTDSVFEGLKDVTLDGNVFENGEGARSAA